VLLDLDSYVVGGVLVIANAIYRRLPQRPVSRVAVIAILLAGLAAFVILAFTEAQ
jgi:hypothetical protein